MPRSNSPGDEQRAGAVDAAATDPIAAEIAAEIADHLATSAEQLESQGVECSQAKEKSQARFGDAAEIGRRCYWIKQGDTLMFRWAIIALLLALSIGLGITTIGSWRSQQRMAEQMNALTEQLKALADLQRATATIPATAADPKPLEITGKAYIGSPDKPAAKARITILDAKDASHVRSVETDDEGNFHSGPLGGGDYCLLAETGHRFVRDRFPRLVQSAPIGVYPGVETPAQRFDLAAHIGGVKIETSRPLPYVQVDDRYTLDTRLMVKVYSSQNRSQPWITAMSPPLAWPVYPQRNKPLSNLGGPEDRSGRGMISRREGQEFYDILGNAELTAFSGTTFGHLASQLPAGKVEIAVAVLADVFPLGYKRPSMPEGDSRQLSKDRVLMNAVNEWQSAINRLSPLPVSARATEVRGQRRYSLSDDSFYWMTKGLGWLWLTHLKGAEEESKLPQPYLVSVNWLTLESATNVPIESGQATQIRVTIPDDLESRLLELVDSTSEPSEFVKATLASAYTGGGSPQNSPFFREARLTVLGTEPLKDEKTTSTGDDSTQ